MLSALLLALAFVARQVLLLIAVPAALLLLLLGAFEHLAQIADFRQCLRVFIGLRVLVVRIAGLNRFLNITQVAAQLVQTIGHAFFDIQVAVAIAFFHPLGGFLHAHGQVFLLGFR